ncbi:MAG: 7-cyano-7-deazaguanine synthase [Nanoarchaeota archaeon]
MTNKAIIICSGGLDSVTTANYAKKILGYEEIIIMFFDYGQRTVKQERYFSKKCSKNLKAKFIEVRLDELKKWSTSLINKRSKVKKLRIIDLKNSKEESNKYYVPCRNTIFLTYALALAESKIIKEKEVFDVLVGFKSEGSESYPDTTKNFVKKINELRKEATLVKGKIKAPLIDKDKEDIIVLANKMGVRLEDTYSCYAGAKNYQHCGVCLSCRLRQEGFYWANTPDPTRYAHKLKDSRKI